MNKYATLKQSRKILSIFEEALSEQVQAILESGLLVDLRDGNIAEVKRNNFRRVLGLKPLEPIPEPLLKFNGTSEISATTKKFIACDNFIVDTSKKAEVKISGLSSDFEESFIGKTEAAIAEKTTFFYHKLMKNTADESIIAEIGGKEKAETTLTEMFFLMKRQGNGNSGLLLANGYMNIFYIRDIDGLLWAVSCAWLNDGWYVDANYIDDPDHWHAGLQVFSRNPSESQS